MTNTTSINPIKQNIQNFIKKSAFNKQGYEVTLVLEYFKEQLLRYINFYEDDLHTIDTILEKGIPSFQRNNNKWTIDMQSKYVENILCGCPSKIQLFCLEKDYQLMSYSGCQIIDGLQRTTAIIEFLKGNIKVFDGLTIFDIKENYPALLRMAGVKLTIEIFRFNTLSEAVEFYIQMNENITHSKEDIQKARLFLKDLKDKNKDVDTFLVNEDKIKFDKQIEEYKKNEEKRKEKIAKQQAAKVSKLQKK